ncbi:MAG: glycosyltransferase family 4 protein [bacterium]|nr:glycosyltransferase family 4 protein [bacterium]
MKILIVTQYFYPEQFIINDFALSLKNKGFEVSVLTGLPNYPTGKFTKGYSYKGPFTEIWKGILINRLIHFPRFNSSSIGLIINYVSFTIASIIRALFYRGKFDLILVFEPSPIFIGLPAIILKKKTRKKIFFWVQDLWPDTLKYAGGISNQKILNIIGSLTKYIYSYCDIILCQSMGFVRHIELQGVEKQKLKYLPNFIENNLLGTEPDKDIENILPKGFRITFAGNIGESQDFDTLLNACKIIKEKGYDDIKWLILGDGRKKDYVAKKVLEYKIKDSFHLMGRFPKEKMPYFFHYSDALIVSLKKNPIFELTIPSKLQGYLAAGKPIIGSLDGVGQNIINEARCGICADAEKPEELAESILNFYNLSEERKIEMGVNGFNYFNKNFTKEQVLKKFLKIVEHTL